MASDPSKPGDDDEVFEEDRPTAMFSREAHSWFTSMAENADQKDADADVVADLARSAVTESSPLSRTGAAPASRSANALGTAPTSAQGRFPSVPGNVAKSQAPETSRLDPKAVVFLAFVGGVVAAGGIGAIAYFLLTPR